MKGNQASRGKQYRKVVFLALAALLALLVTACSGPARSAGLSGEIGQAGNQQLGSPERGREHIAAYGCGSCHTIPGVPGANATVGPPLERWSERHYIAGLLANTPENLVYWIMNPQAVEPGTAMPDMGVDAQDALDIAAYLYTLGDDPQGQLREFGGNQR